MDIVIAVYPESAIRADIHMSKTVKRVSCPLLLCLR